MAEIRYLVDKVAPAVNFYTKHLGFTKKDDWGPVVILNRDNLDLWISGPQSSAGKTLIDGNSPQAGGSNRLVLRVLDLPSTTERLKKARVHFMTEVVKGPAGSWIVISDPSGNPIELFEAK